MRPEQRRRSRTLWRRRSSRHPRVETLECTGREVGIHRVVAHARHDQQSALWEARDDGGRALRRRPHVEATADREHRNVGKRAGLESSATGRARPADAEVRVSEPVRPVPERAEGTGRKRCHGGIEDRLASFHGRVRRPWERAVPAHRGRVEPETEVDRRRDRSQVVQVHDPEERLDVAEPCGVDDGGQLGGETGVQVGVEERAEQREAVDALRGRLAVRQQHLALDGLGGQPVRDRRHIARVVVRRSAAPTVGAERRQCRR